MYLFSMRKVHHPQYLSEKKYHLINPIIILTGLHVQVNIYRLKKHPFLFFLHLPFKDSFPLA